MKKIIVVSGPSGVGKTTLCARVVANEPRIRLCVTATTRAPRTGEVAGQDYHFMSPAEFETGIKNNEFIEHVKLFDAYYGTPEKSIDDIWQSSQTPLLRIDVQGAQVLRKLGYQGLFIFILPPSLEVLKERLKGRGSSTDSLEKRFQQVTEEMKRQSEYDFRVVNDKLDEAVREVKNILEDNFFMNKKTEEEAETDG